MIQNFYNKREQFDKLVLMVQADMKLRRVDDNWTDPSDPSTIGITPPRIAEYRTLFAECGIPRGFEAFHKEEEILFIATAFGLATGGSSKGYAFRLTPPDEHALIESIDGYKPKDARSYWIYQRITTNWYLHYDYDD